MTETAHARAFLSSLSSLPIQHASDSVADARRLPFTSAPILPRMPRAYTPIEASTSKTTTTPTTSSDISASKSRSLTIILKPLRPSSSTPSSVSLSDVPRDASIYDIKTLAAKRTGYAPDKIKILWAKKPVSDSKTIAEVVGQDVKVDGAGEVEMGVMFVGAPTAAPVLDDGVAAAGTGLATADTAALEAEAKARRSAGVGDGDVAMGGLDSAAPAAQGTTGLDVLREDAFWEDLSGFVTQRVRNQEVAEKFVGSWKKQWEKSMT